MIHTDGKPTIANAPKRLTLRAWVGPAIIASFPTEEQTDAYEGASAYLDWLESLPVRP